MYDTLQHHGILGMKWGVRRFQNEDGSLTAAGKRRERKQRIIDDKKLRKERKFDAKTQSGLSDKDLLAKINRLKLENELRDLTNEQLNPGKKAVNDILQSVGTKTAVTVLSGGLLFGINLLIRSKYKGDPSTLKDFIAYVTPKGGKK